MSITVNHETYYTAAEAASYLEMSRPTFYKNVQPFLPEYKHGAFRRTYYRLEDLDQFRGMRRKEEKR